MKRILFALAFVSFCFAASAQVVKEKTKIKKEYKKPSSSTVVQTSTTSNKAYGTTHTVRYSRSTAHRAHRVGVRHTSHASVRHTSGTRHHVVHKKRAVKHTMHYKKLKRKHHNGKYKVKYKA